MTWTTIYNSLPLQEVIDVTPLLDTDPHYLVYAKKVRTCYEGHHYDLLIVWSRRDGDVLQVEMAKFSLRDDDMSRYIAYDSVKEDILSRHFSEAYMESLL